MSRRLAVSSAALIVLLATLLVAARVQSARHPRTGGTLRVEIGAVVNSLDPSVPATNPDESAAKDALDRLLYASRRPDGSFDGVAGSGPFRISEWEPAKHATLSANEDYPQGRPFVDSIDIQFGRAARDRLLDLELNKTDFAEISPEQARLAAERGVRVSASQPDELMAIVFSPGGHIVNAAAIDRAIDRPSIVNFILQKQGGPARSILPQWCSGAAFLFPPSSSAVPEEIPPQNAASAKIVLGYDSADPLEQSIAERIVVNARAAGIYLVSQATSASAAKPAQTPDARLIRWRLPSPHPGPALANFLSAYGPDEGVAAPVSLPDDASPQQIYDTEREILLLQRVIPVAFIPRVYGISTRVRDWQPPAPGAGWPLADVWLDDNNVQGAPGATGVTAPATPSTPPTGKTPEAPSDKKANP